MLVKMVKYIPGRFLCIPFVGPTNYVVPRNSVARDPTLLLLLYSDCFWLLLVRAKGRERAVLNFVWERRGEGGRAVVYVWLSQRYSREKAGEVV